MATSSSSSSSSSTSQSTLSSLSTESTSSTSLSTSSVGLTSSTSSQSTSSTSSESSTSSVAYSSSSSTSSTTEFLDEDEQTIPFNISFIKSKPVLTTLLTSSYAYAGCGPTGTVIRSVDRELWKTFYRTEDAYATALEVFNQVLFIGTSPTGYIIGVDLTDNTSTNYGSFGGSIIDFVLFQNALYAASEGTSTVYRYEPVSDTWNVVYEPSAGKVSSLLVHNDMLYLLTDRPNVASFDGSDWIWSNPGFDNMYSHRMLKHEPWNYETKDYIERSTVVNSQDSPLTEEQINDTFPYAFTDGVASATGDGDALILGGRNTGRIYAYQDETLKIIWQTDAYPVRSIVTLSKGTYLAAIGNRVYLLQCGTPSEETTEQATEEQEEVTTTAENKNIVVTHPVATSVFELGEQVNIQWSSTHGINDAVKIELYKAGEVLFTINSQTANDGTHVWEVPLSLEVADDYQIYVEWLSSGDAQDVDKDLSDNFSVITEAITTTTTTTTEAPTDTDAPDFSSCSAVPIWELAADDYVMSINVDSFSGQVLFTTWNGQIVGCQAISLNAYGSGERKVYANVKDGYGFQSAVSYTSFIYALYRKIAEVNEEKEIVRYRFDIAPSATPMDRITGVFTSQSLFVAEDIGWWKELTWTESKPSDTDVVVCLRTAKTTDELKDQPWQYCFYSTDGESSPITRVLNNIPLAGQYAQIKVTMSTTSRNVTPTVSSVTLGYATKEAVYFFTTKFELLQDTNLTSGIITGSITEPQGTEVTFGVTNKETAVWSDYQAITPNEFFDLEEYDNVKAGIKLVSFGSEIPVVGGFALLGGGEKIQVVTNSAASTF